MQATSIAQINYGSSQIIGPWHPFWFHDPSRRTITRKRSKTVTHLKLGYHPHFITKRRVPDRSQRLPINRDWRWPGLCSAVKRRRFQILTCQCTCTCQWAIHYLGTLVLKSHTSITSCIFSHIQIATEITPYLGDPSIDLFIEIDLVIPRARSDPFCLGVRVPPLNICLPEVFGELKSDHVWQWTKKFVAIMPSAD